MSKTRENEMKATAEQLRYIHDLAQRHPEIVERVEAILNVGYDGDGRSKLLKWGARRMTAAQASEIISEFAPARRVQPAEPTHTDGDDVDMNRYARSAKTFDDFLRYGD